MFIDDDPAWTAAAIAQQAADASTTIDETSVESLLTSFIGMLTEDARAIFWQVMDGVDPSDPDWTFYACEMLRALRHAGRCGLSASAVFSEFGLLSTVTLERLPALADQAARPRVGWLRRRP